jgi:3-hydroxyisobutyrate dehydrogenase/glyoxylate/succinic semialdehyde reductase
MRVGFIGLGIMGGRMARNLLNAKYDLTVYNRTREKAQPLIAEGARWAERPADLAREVDILFTMLATPEVVQTLAAEEDGFLDALPQDALWVDCSTVHPGFSRRMGAVAGACGVRFLDAPVAGTKGPAESGELVFFVGGRAEDLEACRPLLGCMGKKVLHLGGTGKGSAMKMLFNLMLGSAMSAYSEALVLGEALGLARRQVADILLAAPVAAPFLKLKQPLIDQDDFAAHFPLRWMHKDLHLAALCAYESGVALPGLNAVKEIFALAAGEGLGEQDFAAVHRFLSRARP